MDNFIREQGSDTQRPSDFLGNVRIFDGIINWLSRLMQLTEEEQTDAGTYLGDQPGQ